MRCYDQICPQELSVGRSRLVQLPQFEQAIHFDHVSLNLLEMALNLPSGKRNAEYAIRCFVTHKGIGFGMTEASARPRKSVVSPLCLVLSLDCIALSYPFLEPSLDPDYYDVEPVSAVGLAWKMTRDDLQMLK
jgi:hypothetical protein